MDPDKFTDWSAYAGGESIDTWLAEVGFYDLYSDWSLYSVEVSGDDFIMTLYCDDEDYDGEPNFSVSPWDIKEADVIVDTYPVVALDGMGLLNDWALNRRIIAPAIQRVNQWDRNSSIFEKFNLLTGSCDTAFKTAPLQKWMYKQNLYDNDNINYILEGHAMKHLNISYVFGRILVKIHKHYHTGSQQVTPDVIYWFDKGWDEYYKRNSL
jgi:hypothetical protein